MTKVLSSSQAPFCDACQAVPEDGALCYEDTEYGELICAGCHAKWVREVGAYNEMARFVLAQLVRCEPRIYERKS